MLKNLSQETVGEIAFRCIRDDIVGGELAPGSKLKLDWAKERYGISVSTLREILCRLTAESLVVAEGQRGFFVSAVSRRELAELAELRILLEGHAMESAFAKGDLEWEARLVAAHHKLSVIERALLERAAVGRTVDWVRYDWEFHKALVTDGEYGPLMAMLSSVFDRFLRYHLLARSFRGRAVADDHRRLFELALERNAPAAKAMLATHVRNGVDHVLASGRIP